MFSHWISNIDRSKNIFCPEVIFRNSYRSRDNLRRYLRSARTKAWRFPKLIIPIDTASKCDHFLPKNLAPIVNHSQDTRIQMFGKSGDNIAKLFLPKFTWSFNKRHLHIFFIFKPHHYYLIQTVLFWVPAIIKSILYMHDVAPAYFFKEKPYCFFSQQIFFEETFFSWTRNFEINFCFWSHQLCWIHYILVCILP